MNEPESHSLWRCTQCTYAVYEVLYSKEGFVYYRHYSDIDKRVFMKSIPLWMLYFERLSLDDALAEALNKSGGIF